MKEKTSPTIRIAYEGKPLDVPAGISVAAAVLGHAHPHGTCRNSADDTERNPFCLMGVCFECMMEINGQPNIQSCLVQVEEGMVVARQPEPEEKI